MGCSSFLKYKEKTRILSLGNRKRAKGEREGGNYSECKQGATSEQLDLARRTSE